MKRIIALFLIAVLFACGGKSSKEELKKQINDHKAQVRSLNKEISKLQAQLEEMEGSGDKYQVPVKVKNLSYEKFNHYFTVNGDVEAKNAAFISPELNRMVDKIHVDEGRRVTKGTKLISLDTEVTEKNIQEIKTNLELASKVFQKQKDLWEKEIGSEIEYLRAKNNKESLESRLQTLRSQLGKAVIKAPFSGIVDEIMIKEGELATPGRQVINLVNLRVMRIEANVAERYLADVSRGDSVSINFPVYDDYKRVAPIKRIGNVINKDSRTFTIEMQLTNADERIRPNLMAQVTVNDYSRDSAFIVPAIVVKEDRTGSYVYRVKEKDGTAVAEKTYIEPGRSHNDKTMIREGLNIGDQVVVSGFSQVSDGSPVKIK